jgi:hypothetical protein
MKPARLGLVASLTLSVVLGACGGGGGGSTSSDASVDAPAVDASVDAPMPTIHTITVNTTGAGRVTSVPAGIDCGGLCQAPFVAGTQVTLTATPGEGATFTAWTGACTSTDPGACVVTAAGEVFVGATFAGGCMDECPAGGSECVGTSTQRTCGQYDGDACREWWTTVCIGDEECRLGRCGAVHELSVLPLAEAAVGTVTSAPDGITCGLDGGQCQHNYAVGAEVTLTATSDPEAVFAGWALVPLGDTNAMACVGSQAPCTVTMSQVTAIAATYCTPECTLGGVRCSGATNVIETCGEFDGDPCTEFSTSTTCGDGLLCTPAGCRAGFVVTATTQGDGAVAIDGVTCQAPPCTQGVVTGGTARVTAIPGPAAVFTHWSGACTGSGPCTVTSASSVTAHFADRCVDAVVLDTGGFAIDGSTLAVGTELFIGEGNSDVRALFHAPLAGGPGQPAVITARPLWNLTADTSGAYWLEGYSFEFELARYVDGVRQSLVPNIAFGAYSPGAMALGATDLFYLQGTSIMKVAKTGGTPVPVTTTMPLFGRNLAVDATSIYWFGDSIQKFPIGGGEAVTLVPVSGVAYGGLGFAVTQDATHLYWARGLQVPAAIVRVPKAGGPVEPVVAARNVLAMAVRGTTLAWISVDQPPQATTIGSGVVTQLGRRLANSNQPGIAIDTDAVYVTSTVNDSRLSPVISRLVRSATCAP